MRANVDPRRLVYLPIVLAIALAAPLAGQESFRLGDDDEWHSEAAPVPGSPEAQLALAKRALADGRADRAEFLTTQWIERNPRHPLIPEAYLTRGDARVAKRSYYDALYDYEFITQSLAGSEVFVTALERELEIAKLFASGMRKKVWGMRISKADDEAEELLIRIQERLPGSRLAEEAGMTLGDFYFSRQEMALAAEMYAIFIENFPRSEDLAKARKRLIYANLARFKGPEFDASGLYEARTRLRGMKIIDPLAAQQIGADSLITRIDESDAEKLLVTAQWYVRTNDYIAAEMTIRRLVRRYPSSVATRRAMSVITKLLDKLPASVLAEAPDYAQIRAAVTGEPDPATDAASASPATTPADVGTGTDEELLDTGLESDQ